MDLNPVAVFVKVAELGSFSAAARQLSMPNSTVSAQVLRLEHRVGVTLLHRTTRKLRLTEAGEAYFRAALQGVDLIQSAEAAISASQHEPQGMLRITTTTDLLPPGSIAGLLRQFRERHPKINFEVDLTQRLVDLVQEGIDVAIRAGFLHDSRLISRKVGTSVWLLFASPTYLQRAERLSQPTDLRHHDILQFQSKGKDHWNLRRGRVTKAVPLPKRTIINHIAIIKALTLAGAGVALLPTFHAREELSDGRLIQVLPEWTGNVEPIYIVYPEQKYIAAKVRAFVDFAVDAFKVYFRE